MAREEGILDSSDTPRGVFRFDRLRLVLPDVPDRSHEDDLPPSLATPLGDPTHLLDEELAGIDREAFGLLMRVVHVVLRIGDHRDGEGRGQIRAPAGPGMQAASDHPEQQHRPHAEAAEGCMESDHRGAPRAVGSFPAAWRPRCPSTLRRNSRMTGKRSSQGDASALWSSAGQGPPAKPSGIWL